MTEPTSLGALLKRYRLGAGLSQEALAARANVSARAISDLERGLHRMPHADTLDRLASALALTVQPRALLLAAAHPEWGDAQSPPAPAMPASPRRLPLPPNALIGRAWDHARALTVLRHDRGRLLTITGPSGVGKTRLALELAQDCAAEFGDGVAYVELAPLREAMVVSAAVAQALGVRERADATTVDQLSESIGERRMLLVLDNFEQVLAAAPVVAELLARCEHLVALVTSRAPLRLRAEQTLSLGPLPLEEACALFRERAHAVRPGGRLAGADADADVAAICERVDRLPLAIELAAAQLRTLSVAQIREHLAARLPLLRGGARDLPERQQVMADAIGWSYALLNEPQQRCFRALGVFVGGWALEAARAICWEAGAVGAHEAILTLAALVDASLIQAEAAEDGAVRFGMLALMREYALDQLRAAGEEEGCQRRHAEYYAGLADTAAALGPGQGTESARLAVELPNARAALEWAEAQRAAELGLRLTGFTRLWYIRGSLEEATGWYERMLALDAQAREQGAPTAPHTLRVARLYGFARILLGFGELARAEAWATESVELARRTGDEDGMSDAYATLGMIAQASGRLDAAESAYAESYAHALRTDQAGLRSHALVSLAELERLRGDVARAESLMREALAMARAAGDAWDAASMGGMLGRLVQRREGHDEARALLQTSAQAFLAFGSATYLAWCLEALAATLCAQERHARATRLCAAAAALREHAHTPLPPAERDAFEQVVAAAQRALGEAAFAVEWAAGSALTQEAAVAEALASAASRPPRDRSRARTPARARGYGAAGSAPLHRQTDGSPAREAR